MGARIGMAGRDCQFQTVGEGKVGGLEEKKEAGLA